MQDYASVTGTAKEVQLKNNADGGIGYAGGDDRDGEEAENADADEASVLPPLTDLLQDEARVWQCRLDLSEKRERFLTNLEDSPQLRQAMISALAAHAGGDASEAVMKTANTWKRHGVGPAWNPDCWDRSHIWIGERMASEGVLERSPS